MHLVVWGRKREATRCICRVKIYLVLAQGRGGGDVPGWGWDRSMRRRGVPRFCRSPTGNCRCHNPPSRKQRRCQKRWRGGRPGAEAESAARHSTPRVFGAMRYLVWGSNRRGWGRAVLVQTLNPPKVDQPMRVECQNCLHDF